MKKFIILLLLLPLLGVSVKASEIEIPDAPSSAQPYMPYEEESFSEGILYIFSKALSLLFPSITEGVKTAALVLASVLITSLIGSFNDKVKPYAQVIGVICAGTILLGATNALISLGKNTIHELDGYGKLMIPVMTTMLASEGAVGKSAALYAGTTIFSTILTSAITKLLIPMMYILIALSIANRSVGENILASLSQFIKWLMTWLLKIVLYVFTGYITLSGVVTGSADAIAVKAAKIAVSGMVPVVGGIISDASETILVSAGMIKNSAGLYGIFAFISICIGPFVRIAVQYVILKITAAVSGVFGMKNSSGVINDFSQVMGILLAATGSICLMLLITIVSFLKGIH